jgi:hypothetical protein
MDMARRPVRHQFDVEHALRDDAALAGAGEAGILDGVFQIEEHARRGAGVALVDQHGAALQQVAVALQREVDDGVEQRMTGADERGQRLALRRDQRLLEGDALVARQHGFADADQSVAVAHGAGTWVIS